MPYVGESSYHRIKKKYLVPAVDVVSSAEHTRVVHLARENLKKVRIHELYNNRTRRLSQGEKLCISGDAQFDTRGYCAIWGRYVLTYEGLVIAYANLNKKTEGIQSQNFRL